MARTFHPDEVISDINSLMEEIDCSDEDLRSVAIEIANWALPPPETMGVVRGRAGIRPSSGLVERIKRIPLSHFCKRESMEMEKVIL